MCFLFVEAKLLYVLFEGKPPLLADVPLASIRSQAKRSMRMTTKPPRRPPRATEPRSRPPGVLILGQNHPWVAFPPRMSETPQPTEGAHTDLSVFFLGYLSLSPGFLWGCPSLCFRSAREGSGRDLQGLQWTPPLSCRTCAALPTSVRDDR